MTQITVRHLRLAKMCARSARPWFARQGLSWDTFIAEGYDADTLRATGDALALKVIAVAESEVTSEKG